MLRICEKRVSLLNTRNAYQFERVRSLRLESHFDINFKDRGVENLWRRLSLLNEILVMHINLNVQDRSRITHWSISILKIERRWERLTGNWWKRFYLNKIFHRLNFIPFSLYHQEMSTFKLETCWLDSSTWKFSMTIRYDAIQWLNSSKMQRLRCRIRNLSRVQLFN